jgi:hypothetical protein
MPLWDYDRTVGNVTEVGSWPRRSMMRRVLVSALVGGLGSLGVLVAAAPALASNPVTYTATDPTPDVSAAPDITNVLVWDTTQGLITFQINFAPGTEQQAQDTYSVWIDSDQNPTTGDPTAAGIDYAVAYDGTQNGLGLFKWDGTSSYRYVSNASLTGSFSGDSQYFVIPASELGITDGFNFNVSAALGPVTSPSSQVDQVPEDGTNFHYAMQSRPIVTLRLTNWASSAVARTGQLYLTALLVTRSDTGSPVGSGTTVSCRLVVHGRTVPPLLNGFQKWPWPTGGSKTAAVCAWRLPNRSVGAVLKAKETVTLGTSTVSRVFTPRVRK